VSNSHQASRYSDLEGFYMARAPRLVGVLTVMSGSRETAEEIVQDAFARLIPRWERVSRYEAPEAWLLLVAVRLLRSRQRRDHWPLLKRDCRASQPDQRQTAPVPDIDMDVRSALMSLPAVYREVAVLYYVCDLAVEDVGRHLGVPTGTVKSRLARARQALSNTKELGARHE